MPVADLIVEDGSGLPNADSYVAIAEANTYFIDRPTHKYSATWSSATDDNKKSALRVATEMLDMMYTYKTTKAVDTQSLNFPIKDSTTVPLNVKKATIELAVRALSGDLLDDNEGREVESEKYDVVEFHYKTTGSVPQKAYTIVETYMKAYIVSKNIYTVDLCR